jgi:colanic acid/amylovoran biosynthesis glycosyltransferase
MMKRVLYFIPEFPRISETFIEREVAKLIELSTLDITILSLAKASGTTSQKVYERTQYRRINWLTCFLALGYFFLKPHRVITSFKRYFQGNNSSVLKKLHLFLKSVAYTKLIENQKPEHIHVHFFSWPSSTVMIASTILEIPYSISGHAKDVFLEGELIKEKLKTCKFMSICNSYAYNKTLEVAGESSDTEKIHLIYHGVDPKVFEGKSLLPKVTVPRIFLGGTRLVEKKGITYMIEASKLLLDKGILHQVDLVGPGELYDQLTDQTKKLGLEKTVLVHGEGKGTPFSEVLEYYKVADVFVLPSIETKDGDVDGVPTVVIEAAMAKIPIISTNAGGITDLITDNVTGILVPQKDPTAIAEAIEKLLTDRPFAEKLMTNAYNKAIGMFDLEQNIGKLESLLTKD